MLTTLGAIVDTYGGSRKGPSGFLPDDGLCRPNNLDYAATQIWMTPCARTPNSSLIGYKAPRRGILTNSDGVAHIEDLARSLRLWEYINGNLPEHICACFLDALAMQLDPHKEI